MKDQEAVLRYLAFKIFDYKLDYKGDMSDFLEQAMRKINVALSDENINQLKQDFKRVMIWTFDYFGNRNFRFPTTGTRGRINIAMLESIAYFFSQQTDDFLKQYKKQIQKNFEVLLKDAQYIDAVRYSTGNKEKVITRFDRVQEILGHI